MIYRIDCDRWGRFFSVPCSVVDEHIKLSDGAFVKVLLCLLCSNSHDVDTQQLAEQAGVSEQVAHDSIIYWTERGVITASTLEGREIKQSIPTVTTSVITSNSKPVVNFTPTTQAVSEVEAINPAKNSPASKAHVKYSPKELAEITAKNDDIKLLVNDIQKTLCKTINATEMASLINLHEFYGFSAASILMIASYCHQLGKDRIAYIETVARDWFERGIVEYVDVEKEIICQSELKSFYNKIARVLSIEGKLTKKQIEYIEKWRSMGYNIEMIEIAAEKCMNAKNKIILSYIDGIFNNWSGKSIKTPTQVNVEDEKFAGSNKKKSNKVENKDTSFDINEITNYAYNFNPNERGE